MAEAEDDAADAGLLETEEENLEKGQFADRRQHLGRAAEHARDAGAEAAGQNRRVDARGGGGDPPLPRPPPLPPPPRGGGEDGPHHAGPPPPPAAAAPAPRPLPRR